MGWKVLQFWATVRFSMYIKWLPDSSIQTQESLCIWGRDYEAYRWQTCPSLRTLPHSFERSFVLPYFHTSSRLQSQLRQTTSLFIFVSDSKDLYPSPLLAFCSEIVCLLFDIAWDASQTSRRMPTNAKCVPFQQALVLRWCARSGLVGHRGKCTQLTLL